MKRFSRTAPRMIHRFDLLDEERVIVYKHAVDSSAQLKVEFQKLHFVRNRNFGLVPDRPKFLNALMSASSRKRAVRSAEQSRPPEISRAKHELDEFAHRNGNYLFRAALQSVNKSKGAVN